MLLCVCWCMQCGMTVHWKPLQPCRHVSGHHHSQQAYLQCRVTAERYTAMQVESIIGDIGQLPGMTLEILKDTNVGKAVSKLAKLGKLHPSIMACDQIASKARSNPYLQVTLPRLDHKIAFSPFPAHAPHFLPPSSPLSMQPPLAFPKDHKPPSPPSSFPLSVQPVEFHDDMSQWQMLAQCFKSSWRGKVADKRGVLQAEPKDNGSVLNTPCSVPLYKMRSCFMNISLLQVGMLHSAEHIGFGRHIA